MHYPSVASSLVHSHSRLVVACSLLALASSMLCACESFDPELIEPAQSSDAGQDQDPILGGVGGRAGGTASQADAGDGGGAGMGMAGSAAGAEGCMPNPALGQLGCPLICPESCNGLDDDCDGSIDEPGMDELCQLDHATAACTEGRCLIVECIDGHRDCDDDVSSGCEVAPDDVENCGTCGNVCDLPNAIEACVDGACTAVGCDALYGDCDDDPTDCEMLVNTLENCAVCGVACGELPNATQSCELGFCGVAACAPGFGDCNTAPGDGCEQTLDTLAHCGGCDTPCDLPGSVDDCVTGTCLESECEPDHRDCDGDPSDGCDSLDSDSHCGACNTPCDVSLTNVDSAGCESQQCTLACSEDFGDCDDNRRTGCETEVTSLARCGGCDTPCAIEHAVVTCDPGECTFVRCDPGWGDCNHDLERDGCETSLNADDTCGSCDNDCTETTDPVCSGGTCTDVVCPDQNTADCNQDGLPCEVNLMTNAGHCGACNAPCEFATGTPHATGLRCATGSCEPLCDRFYDDCNGDHRDGCETALTTLTHCGLCGMACAIANATASCASGTCEVDECAPDWADCNTDDRSCETQLGTLQNCTGCGMACNLPNAVNACAGSAGSHSCAISACLQNFANCDGTVGNGCEVDRRSNAQHCGACGNNCTQHANVRSATCSGSACSYTCAPGFGNCTSAAGCETALNTATDCGGCGVACSRANGSASCQSGSCQLTGCDDGFDNCDDDGNNGCEPLNTLADCDACGSPCLITNGVGTCETRSCLVASCNAGWEDCDGVPDNGCERNVEPPAMGGLGPCQPDSDCTRFVHDDRDYYFCTGNRSWADARARCQLQLLGDLVHINDAAEDAFVHAHAAADAWIGAQDTVEGTWRWANDGAQFWMGTASGSALAYAHWNAGEPNNSNSNEDCAEMYPTGLWNDQVCTNTRDFVCEVQADLCPSDPDKANPGQCGCGTPDTDGDSDGTANCNDDCPADPLKVDPGACGCGMPDTDGDGDGTPNCDDGCPSDPQKIAAGACGCGNADTDTDGDGTADCNDGCPADAMRTAPPCGFSYTPSNFDPAGVDFDGAPTATLNCGTTTVDTSGSVTISNWCGTTPAPLLRPQASGPEAVILPLQGLSVTAGNTLRVIGARPLILAVRGNAAINGTINARAVGATPGAGGNVTCGAGNGANGESTGNSNDGGGGGGGGAFGAAGAVGGGGDSGQDPGAGGAVEGNATLTPLRGGCRGGNGGNGNGTGGPGGAGGGAVQISASGSITLASGSIVSASGGGALRANNQEDGGGGGGSGGALLLEAGSVNVSSGAWLTANGGGGSSGSGTSDSNSQPGTDGYPNNTARAPGGPGNNGGGLGGNGGASAGGAQSGGDGEWWFLSSGGGGGGGGGGVGRIRVRGATSCGLSGTISPSPSLACP